MGVLGVMRCRRRLVRGEFFVLFTGGEVECAEERVVPAIRFKMFDSGGRPEHALCLQ